MSTKVNGVEPVEVSDPKLLFGTKPVKPSKDLIKSVVDPRIKASSKRAKSEGKSITDRLFFYLFHLILLTIYGFYSIFRSLQYVNNRIRIKFLNLAYNPSKTPQIIRDDVNKLSKLPKRLSAVLNLKPEEEEGGGFYGLLNDASELTTWTLASGISTLSIYEYEGTLKNNVEDLRAAIFKKLRDYFGPTSIPKFVVKIPHLNVQFYGLNHDDDDNYKNDVIDIEVSLLSVEDGKATIVELTKTLAELAKKKEISSKNITVDLIDGELTELVGIEPDLIILFTPTLALQGYPPWHIRLSEFYWEADNEDVTYAIFLRALQKYSTCKINVGK
ncbi:Undecaprenyl pyrophosphate synthetase [Wickerhamomyces ciferrii]|uniref:ditrans,polycis-polyprenyl diphosphate synthase [(2E,6E)-farnesyldiphosphate specific] n=1 Tax=Wickerhamomyces ciferrii (strain ATCC 14091 / BCRC 22168 / CBS 111 / JCM 3599 / NBRC 0793 / NRRL Y-1031 F-60-10) TaxID=1206466 RepID=K0KGY2_WICCF|nr:Undecaprenyl pyrophosphate synthetase [Wickerhamomyces ciferrii]CCH41442.1 Undecaprenyl pyrophosphate synthetase [Wickerhamomyces ciferrii]